jgi:predicted Zn-dependent peptidase
VRPVAAGLEWHATTLPNGLRVIGEVNPRAASAAVGVVVETGGRDEDASEHGVSHFLEHLCFKGTATRDAIGVSRAFDALGARYNAFTSDERTVYHGAVLPEVATDLLELLLDMMQPALRDDDVAVERQVVLEEIAMDEDKPAWVAFDRARRAYFGDHPIGRSLLGTPASIRALGPDAVRAYHGRRYVAANTLVVVSGRFDWDAIVDTTTRATRDWPTGNAERCSPPLDPAAGERRERIARFGRAHVALLAPGVARDDPRRIAAALLARVIGDHDNSLLFWSLIEPGLADEAALWHDEAEGLGTFQGYLSTDVASLPRVLEATDDLFTKLQQGGLDPAAWSMARRALATGLTLRGETPLGRLMALASGYLDRGRFESVDDVVEEVLATPLELGAELLSTRPFDARLTYVIGPLEGGVSAS